MSSANRFYAALSDKLRRRLLALLLQEDELCVCELVEVMRLPQPKVSQHLSILRDAGVVTVRKSGRRIFYRLSAHAPVWIYKIVESMANGESADANFIADAARLERRPVRHAEIDRVQRNTVCKPCNTADRTVRERAAA